MPVEEIFKEVSKHMIEGLMFHEQLSEYYLFLGLDGYSKCHDYHYLCESKAFSKLNKMFVTLFNKLLPALIVSALLGNRRHEHLYSLGSPLGNERFKLC